MSTPKRLVDVFLSHSAADAAVAAKAASILLEQGLSVFRTSEVFTERDQWGHVREAVAECLAFVALVTPDRRDSGNQWLEIGVAKSWDKPVFFLLDHVEVEELPLAFQNHRAFKLEDASYLAQAILRLRRAVSDEQAALIGSIYAQMNVPVDQLLTDPEQLDALVAQFNSRSSSSISAERLMQLMLRMRKQGRLARSRSRSIPSRTRKHSA